MEDAPAYPRHHVSECPLPEISESAVFGATYIAGDPAADVCDELATEAQAIIDNAGLHGRVRVGHTSVSRDRFGVRRYVVTAYDPSPATNVLDFASAAFGMAATKEATLAIFSKAMLSYARQAGLLLEGSQACA